MTPRCQFGIDPNGRCGALLTYPIRDLPWRRNIMRSFEFDISEQERQALFDEVARLRAQFPNECLDDSQLWSDSSEKANGITRDRETNTVCVTVGVYAESGDKLEYFSMREDSPALLSSKLYRTVERLIEPHEKS